LLIKQIIISEVVSFQSHGRISLGSTFNDEVDASRV